MLKLNQGQSGCGDGETEPMENFPLGKWNIGISYYEKIEKWLPFHKYASYRKNFKLPTLGLQFSECQWKQNTGVNHYGKFKNGHYFINMHHTE